MKFKRVSGKGEYSPYNFTEKNDGYRPIKVNINDSSFRNKLTVDYVNALVDEKEELMKLYNL